MLNRPMARDLENQRRWAKAEKRRAYIKKWREDNRAKMIESGRKSYYKHREKNIRRVVEGVRKRKERLAGRPRTDHCEICLRVGSVVFDHCHTTGKFRGWLCTRCNRYLGWVENNLALIDKMKQYLESFHVRPDHD